MSTAINNVSFNSYELEVLSLVNNEGEAFDIKGNFIECVITESISVHWLSGEIFIADLYGFLERAKLTGQESLRIRYRQPAGIGATADEVDTIDQIFRIYSITHSDRVDHSASVHKLSFISPEGFEAMRTRISTAFRGNLSDLIAKVSEEYLGIQNQPTEKKLVPHFELRKKSEGDNFHVVIPNWTIDYTIEWLCENAQATDSQKGIEESFFFFQTANGGYRVQSLSDMYKLKYLNGDSFIYSRAHVNDPKTNPWDEGKTGMGRRIIDYIQGNVSDTLGGTMSGLFSSNQTTINNTFKYHVTKSYDYLERFYGSGESINEFPLVRQGDITLYVADEASDNTKVPVTSPYMTFKPINSYKDACRFLTSDSSYVHDINNNIVQSNFGAHLGGGQFRQAAKLLLGYSTIQCLLPARTDISCGQIINLDILPAGVYNEDEEVRFHSGDYLITSVQWSLTRTACSTNITAMKDSVPNRFETAKVDYDGSIKYVSG